MKKMVVLTVISEDNPGIVETLSETLVKHGGSWFESSMLSLAGKFAGILLADVPENHVKGFIADLTALKSAGMQIVAELCGDTNRTAEDARSFVLELVGQDHPGIVHDITRILAKHQVNVVALDTERRDASMSGETLFAAQAHISIPAQASVEALQDELETLANELMVDIKLAE
jgi:glycine cleavage system regulatory protein